MPLPPPTPPTPMLCSVSNPTPSLAPSLQTDDTDAFQAAIDEATRLAQLLTTEPCGTTRRCEVRAVGTVHQWACVKQLSAAPVRRCATFMLLLLAGRPAMVLLPCAHPRPPDMPPTCPRHAPDMPPTCPHKGFGNEGTQGVAILAPAGNNFKRLRRWGGGGGWGWGEWGAAPSPTSTTRAPCVRVSSRGRNAGICLVRAALRAGVFTRPALPPALPTHLAACRHLSHHSHAGNLAVKCGAAGRRGKCYLRLALDGRGNEGGPWA